MVAVEQEWPLRRWKAAFPADVTAIPMARRVVRSKLGEWGWGSDSERVHDVLLVFAELTTNAIRHASKPGDIVRVLIDETGGYCRIEVRDSRPDLPLLKVRAGGSDEHGRGLLLVQSLAYAMGEELAATTKKVWASVRVADDLARARCL
ncbi:ATP-binding protein [Kitasatospora sp. NPDC056783]|uniref:ATP-binding protein n=1 Tax=Kitasatospora sp. NPDC056783 TaxID=3345943 RepID=UPI003677E43E